MAFPIVYHLVTQLGERQDLAMFDQNVIVFSAAVVHGMVLGATALGAG
jgi:hypothetical protein